MIIEIRPYTLDDADALTTAVHESLADLSPWMSWADAGFCPETARTWIAAQIAAAGAGDAYEFAIVDKAGLYLGGCGVNRIQRDLRYGNLGYWIRTSAAGRGVAVRAVDMLARWAFAHTELERLELLCAVGNLRSQRVAEKAGAEREGTLRARLRTHDEQLDAVLYAIVRGDLSDQPDPIRRA